MMPVKLGKARPRFDNRTLAAFQYMKALPPPPAKVSWADGFPDSKWGMLGNDIVGDCALACPGHQIMEWTYAADGLANTVFPSTTQILAAYSAVTGYVIGDPSTDNGAVVLDVLNYWRKTGIAGHKIFAFVQVNPSNITEMKQAIDLFGSVYVGMQLPVSAQSPSTGANGLPLWSVPPTGPIGNATPGSWGGHAIPVIGYGTDAKGNAGTEIVTWGQRYDVTWQWHHVYTDEAWAIITTDWLEANGNSPSGFDIASLQADLKLITA